MFFKYLVLSIFLFYISVYNGYLVVSVLDFSIKRNYGIGSVKYLLPRVEYYFYFKILWFSVQYLYSVTKMMMFTVVYELVNLIYNLISIFKPGVSFITSAWLQSTSVCHLCVYHLLLILIVSICLITDLLLHLFYSYRFC